MKITVYWLTSEDSKGTFTRLFESKAKRDAAFTTWLREHIDKEDAGGTAGLVTDDEDHLLARLTAGEHPASVYGDYLELKTGNYAIDGQAEVTIPNRKPNTEALAILHNVVTRWPQFDDGREVNGTELVDWFSHFRTKAKLISFPTSPNKQDQTPSRWPGPTGSGTDRRSHPAGGSQRRLPRDARRCGLHHSRLGIRQTLRCNQQSAHRRQRGPAIHSTADS